MRGIFLKGGRDLAVLRSIQVFEVMDRNFEKILPSTPLGRIMQKIESTRETYYMVVDEEQRLHGIISLQDLRSVITKGGLDELIIAEDIAHTDYVSVTPDDNMETVRRKIGRQDLQLIPVVESPTSDRVIAVLRRDDMMTIYNKRLIDSFGD
jgi:CIC family chloride channel protein